MVMQVLKDRLCQCWFMIIVSRAGLSSKKIVDRGKRVQVIFPAFRNFPATFFL